MRKTAALLLAVMMACALAACAKGGDLTLATGSKEGTYYGFGTVLASEVSGKTKTRVEVVSSNGSKQNIESLLAGSAQLGFAQSDVAAYAYEGTRLYETTGKIDMFSAVAALYLEQVQIVTLDPGIKSVYDLKGKNVSIGAAGSGVYFNAVDVLGTYGIDAEDGSEINVTYLSFADSAKALRNHMIDAAFIVAGTPAQAITDLAGTETVYLVGMDDVHVDLLIDKSPYYSKTVIPKEVYGTAEDVETVAVTALVIARNDTPDKDVYNFISGIFDNLDDLKAAHAKGSELDLEFAASYGAVPYHSGAVKYFNEKKIEVG